MSEKDGFYFKEKNIKGRCEMTIKVSYIDSAGILNKAVLKIISCGESDDSGCLWLTADNNPNFACLYTNWRSYSPMSDLYSDVLGYIEDYITDDGYAEITDVDYSYGEFEFTRKIMSGKFDSSYRNLITGCSIYKPLFLRNCDTESQGKGLPSVYKHFCGRRAEKDRTNLCHTA